MKNDIREILSVKSLLIGYFSTQHSKSLLSPLTASGSEGEMIAVIGKNGIGKSTLLRTLAGLQPALGGEISFNGKNILDYSRVKLAQQMGYMSTEIIKVSNMTVYDLAALGRFPHTNWLGKIDKHNNEMIMLAIEMAGMTGFYDRFISELSDGERQRAMIARILAQDTAIMIMDEPTAFLDIGSKYEILHLMYLLSSGRRKTIIFSTHDLNMAIDQSDKIWLLLDDKLIQGAPEDLMIMHEFDNLFDSSPVHFNSENGAFTFDRERRVALNIKGEGILKHWTEKAINRAGFFATNDIMIPSVHVPSGSNANWILITDRSTVELVSLYDLVKWLKDNIIDLI